MFSPTNFRVRDYSSRLVFLHSFIGQLFRAFIRKLEIDCFIPRNIEQVKPKWFSLGLDLTCFNGVSLGFFDKEKFCNIFGISAGRSFIPNFFWIYCMCLICFDFSHSSKLGEASQLKETVSSTQGPEFEPCLRLNVLICKQGSIAHSLLLSPAHCPDITEILLKRM